LKGLKKLELEVAELREWLGQNSQNSSKHGLSLGLGSVAAIQNQVYHALEQPVKMRRSCAATGQNLHSLVCGREGS
jgi:hypothetical protein